MSRVTVLERQTEFTRGTELTRQTQSGRENVLDTILGLLDDQSILLPIGYETLTPPAKGSSYIDPVFGTTVVRISDAIADGLNLVTHEYPAVTPFACDCSKIVLYGEGAAGNGLFIVDTTGTVIVTRAALNAGGTIMASGFRWSRTDPNVFYAVRGGSNALIRGTITGSTVSFATIHTFSAYSNIRIDGGGEADLSEDGDRIIIVGNTSRYVLNYKISTDETSAVFDTLGLGGGWDFFAFAPDNQIVGQWFDSGTGDYNGLQLYDLNMVRKRQVVPFVGHASRGRNALGEPVTFMQTDNDGQISPSYSGGEMIRLSDSAKTKMFEAFDWNMANHESLNNAQHREWALITVQGVYLADLVGDLPPTWVTDWKRNYHELVLISLADPTYRRRLVHLRSRKRELPINYNWQSRGTLSPDGCFLLFASNMGLEPTANYECDVYLIQLRALPSERVAPTISSVVSSPGDTQVTITWTTNELATAQVEWGLTTFYAGGITPLDLVPKTAHSVTITGLTATTLYHYRVQVRDMNGNLARSADFTFTTTAAGIVRGGFDFSTVDDSINREFG